MAKKPTKPPNEDAEQSKRFIDAAKDMEAAGDVNLTEAEVAFDRLLNKAAPAKRPKQA